MFSCLCSWGHGWNFGIDLFKFLGIEYIDHKLDTSWYCYVAFGVGMDLLVIGAHGYLDMVMMLISLGLEKYFLGQLMVSARSSRGNHLIWTWEEIFLRWFVVGDLDILMNIAFPTLGLLEYFLLERHNPLFLSGALCLCLSFMDMDLDLWYIS